VSGEILSSPSTFASFALSDLFSVRSVWWLQISSYSFLLFSDFWMMSN
jgi:hypothetical protein